MINTNHRYLLVALMLTSTVIVTAAPACGATDYTSHSYALYNMVVFVLACMTAVLSILYVLATIIGLYSATTIYIKMQSGEDGIMKSIYLLVGACIFLVAASLVLPSFFGYTSWGSDHLSH